MTVERIAVVGLGLIGCSVAAGLRRTGAFLQGFDLRRDNARVAIDRGFVDVTTETLGDALREADVVVLAVPVLAIVDLLPAVDELAPPGAMIIDTGSVKAPVVDVMATLKGAGRAVGGHPIAGKERAGAAAADPDLCAGRPFAIVPSVRTADATVRRAETLASWLGARPVIVDARQHDRILASSSHLPQMLASTLAQMVEPSESALSGPGFEDMTRLARSDASIWRDILLANRGQVVEASYRYIGRLQKLVQFVETVDGDAIEEFLRAGQESAAQPRSGVVL